MLVCFMFPAGNALAEGFALYEYSARGIALGGAMMARKPDASVIAYNPALIARLPGTHAMAGVTAVTPHGSMTWEDPADGKDSSFKGRETWMMPHGYFTHQINDDWTFGIGEFSRFGLGFEYDADWPGRYNITKVSLQTASLNPNIAWRATDELSLAAGVELIYATLDIRKSIETPYGDVESDIKDADDVSFGFNLAAHYQFNEQWAAGLAYRSQARVHAYGATNFTGAGNPLVGTMFRNGSADSTVILPDSVAAGISWTPIPELSVEVGAIWTNWSSFRHLNIHLPDPIGVSKSNKHWDDAWRFNLGVEYALTDWLDLRAGYVYDQSPMTEEYEDYLVPTDGRHIYSLGFGLHEGNWTFDFAFAYIDAKGRDYEEDTDGSQVHPTYVKNSSSQGHSTMFSFSMGYKF
ncbi:MAG: OmpP1/FadL family transporter [Deltaproteobacteria bacterium]|jgi:long-chain fatty acid transport protein|nr:OmpP1/FadL family transporter [Deltaproteobacteria bacterium]